MNGLGSEVTFFGGGDIRTPLCAQERGTKIKATGWENDH